MLLVRLCNRTSNRNSYGNTHRINAFHHQVFKQCVYTYYTQLVHVSAIYRGHLQGVNKFGRRALLHVSKACNSLKMATVYG
jgi:hypothetical protein